MFDLEDILRASNPSADVQASTNGVSPIFGPLPLPLIATDNEGHLAA